MKHLILILLFLSSVIGLGQNPLYSSFIHDDFGAYEFNNEIVSVILQAKSQNINEIDFNISEVRKDTKHTDKREVEETLIKCLFTSDSSISVFKNYKYGTRCYSWGYNFLIKFNVFILDNVYSISKQDEIKYGCEDTHKRYSNFEKETFSIDQIKDTTFLTVNRNYFTVNQNDTLKMNDYHEINIYKILSREKIVEVACSNCRSVKVSYPTIDTTIYNFYYLDDEFTSTYKVSKTIRTISERELINTETAYIKTNQENTISHSSFTSKYWLNKKGMPIKIEILNGGLWDKSTGSKMMIKYKTTHNKVPGP